MNTGAMAAVLKETAKDWRIKIYRNDSVIFDRLYLMIFNENKTTIDNSSDNFLIFENNFPASFFISDLKRNPEFMDAVCECILGDIDQTDKIFDILDRMFFDHFSIQQIIVIGSDENSKEIDFDDLDGSCLSFVIGSYGFSTNHEFILSTDNNFNELFTEEFYQNIRTAAES
ncbi:MAG: hypothetical protein AAB847_00240 [Patescibacteria group bacterium]